MPSKATQEPSQQLAVVFNLSTDEESSYLLKPIEALVSAAILADKRAGDLINEPVRNLYRRKIRLGPHHRHAFIGDLGVKITSEDEDTLSEEQERWFKEVLEKVKDHPHFSHSCFPYIDFEETVVEHGVAEFLGDETYSGWQLTLAFDGSKPGYYFNLRVNDIHGWTTEDIPKQHKAEVTKSLEAAAKTIQNISGISIDIA